MSSPGTLNLTTGKFTPNSGIYTLAPSFNGDGIHGVGGGSGLRVEGDLEVTGDMPRTVHVSKCEVAPAECRCIVQVAEPAERPWLPKDYFALGTFVGVILTAVAVELVKRWVKSW